MEIDDVEFMLIDTVRFLKNLPHDLIDAFHSTLESALNCDLALIVCDATGEYEMQLKTTLDTLDALHFNAPYIVVMNKSETLRDFEGYPTDAVFISAKENLGTEVLKREILKRFQNDYVFCSLRVPYRSVSDYNANKKYLKERNIIFNDFGMLIDAVIPAMYISKFHDFIDR